MEIRGYAVNGQIRTGIAWHQRNKRLELQMFFWSPQTEKAPEVFAKWNGHGWQLLPIDRLPHKRRSQLVGFWEVRGQRK